MNKTYIPIRFNNNNNNNNNNIYIYIYILPDCYNGQSRWIEFEQ